jgi:cytochrome c biogenesis protein
MRKFTPDLIIKRLANLKFAIVLLFTIGLVIALGTFIEQEQSLSFYQQNYPQTKPILGFINWNIILALKLDHIYTSSWFSALLIVFSTSLLSCTLTVQLPSLRRFRRWKFFTNLVNGGGIEKKLSTNTNNAANYTLHYSNYHTFRQGKKNYAYSGLLGRVGPIIVHASIILLLLGSSIGAFGGYLAQEIIPRGEIFHVQNLVKSGNFGHVPQAITWRVNDFWITYTKDLKTKQFYSDLSLLDTNGNELKRKTIFVNEPFVYKNLTLYQTDWDIVSFKLRVNSSQIVQVPLQKSFKGGRKFWFGSFEMNNEKFSFLVNDLRGNLLLYNEKGLLVKECLIGEKINLDSNTQFEVSELITSTGLQIKTDPGLRVVYLSFFLLICSVYASFISYSQIWGIEKNNSILFSGNSNRAVLFFQTEFKKLLGRVE